MVEQERDRQRERERDSWLNRKERDRESWLNRREILSIVPVIEPEVKDGKDK